MIPSRITKYAVTDIQKKQTLYSVRKMKQKKIDESNQISYFKYQNNTNNNEAM